jgi:hypothetical protein
LSLCLINFAPSLEGVWGSGDVPPSFLTWALHRGERSASYPSRFTPWARAPSTHWIWGWVGPRIGLDVV